jgi:hypothetical protein
MQQREPIVVDLLSVQPPFDGHVRLFFSEQEIRAFHDEDAERELAPVHRASQIVLGPPRGRGLSEMVLGSLTRQIEHLMESTGSRCEVL